jgi:hypothetical protein
VSAVKRAALAAIPVAAGLAWLTRAPLPACCPHIDLNDEIIEEASNA